MSLFFFISLHMKSTVAVSHRFNCLQWIFNSDSLICTCSLKMGNEGFAERHWLPQGPDSNFYPLLLFEEVSLCKWGSYFNFIESCPLSRRATLSQHFFFLLRKKSLQIQSQAVFRALKYAMWTQEVFYQTFNSRPSPALRFAALAVLAGLADLPLCSVLQQK